MKRQSSTQPRTLGLTRRSTSDHAESRDIEAGMLWVHPVEVDAMQDAENQKQIKNNKNNTLTQTQVHVIKFGDLVTLY